MCIDNNSKDTCVNISGLDINDSSHFIQITDNFFMILSGSLPHY